MTNSAKVVNTAEVGGGPVEVTGDLGQGKMCGLTIGRKGSRSLQEKLSVDEVWLLQGPEGTKGFHISFCLLYHCKVPCPPPH